MTGKEAATKKLRGAVLLGYFQFIQKHWGKNAIETCAKEIGFESSDIFEPGWYDLNIVIDLLNWIKNNHGEEFIEKCGAYSIKNLGYLSYIVRTEEVHSILMDLEKNYSNAYNFGEIEIKAKKNSATIKLDDSVADKHFWDVWHGALNGIMEISKARGDITLTHNETNGGPHYEFQMKWKK